MADLVALKREQEAARDVFYRWVNANVWGQVWGQPPERLVEIDIAYRRAQKRYDEACHAYNQAIEDAINGRD